MFKQLVQHWLWPSIACIWVLHSLSLPYTLKVRGDLYFTKSLKMAWQNIRDSNFCEYIACLVLRPVANKFSQFYFCKCRLTHQIREKQSTAKISTYTRVLTPLLLPHTVSLSSSHWHTAWLDQRPITRIAQCMGWSGYHSGIYDESLTWIFISLFMKVISDMESGYALVCIPK